MGEFARANILESASTASGANLAHAPAVATPPPRAVGSQPAQLSAVSELAKLAPAPASSMPSTISAQAPQIAPATASGANLAHAPAVAMPPPRAVGSQPAQLS